jgi:glycosidase
MKKFLACVLCSAMVLGTAGCSLAKKEQTTALELMEETNSGNFLTTDNNSRLWYQVDPYYFADGNGDGVGDLGGLRDYLSYLGNGSSEDEEDGLTMTGILLTSLLLKDDSDVVSDFTRIDPTIADETTLASFCQTASTYNMPVMITLDLSSISKTSGMFTSLVQAVQGLTEEQTIEDVPEEIRQMFSVEYDKNEENWSQIEGTNYWYLSWPQSDTPMLQQDSEVLRSYFLSVIDYWLGLGVSGFYLPDFNAFFPGQQDRNTEFVNWFTSAVKERKADAYVIAAYNDYTEDMDASAASLSITQNIGAEGMLAKAVTGVITPSELGLYLETISKRGAAGTASFVNNSQNSLDLLKSASRLPQLKILLALQLMQSGQVMIMAGDELGTESSQVDLISDAITSNSDEEGEQINLPLGNYAAQKQDGNSVLNFVLQGIKLRDSYISVSSGTATVKTELTGDQVLAMEKNSDTSHTIVLFNLSSSAATVDTSSVTISGLPAEMGGVLLTGTEDVTFENNILTMPAYSVVVLK